MNIGTEYSNMKRGMRSTEYELTFGKGIVVWNGKYK